MTVQQLTTLLQTISLQHVYAFFLVLTRISPLFLVSPVFSSQMLVPRVRSVLAVALALGMTPLAEHGQHINPDVFALVGLALQNFIVASPRLHDLMCVRRDSGRRRVR